MWSKSRCDGVQPLCVHRVWCDGVQPQWVHRVGVMVCSHSVFIESVWWCAATVCSWSMVWWCATTVWWCAATVWWPVNPPRHVSDMQRCVTPRLKQFIKIRCMRITRLLQGKRLRWVGWFSCFAIIGSTMTTSLNLLYRYFHLETDGNVNINGLIYFHT